LFELRWTAVRRRGRSKHCEAFLNVADRNVSRTAKISNFRTNVQPAVMKPTELPNTH
jgi:hypothetical protein